MANVFKCKKCGQSIIVNYLNPGEIALCKMCNTENVVPENLSEKKNEDDDINNVNNGNIELSSMKSDKENFSSFAKYPALVTISGILKFTAYFELIISIGILIFGITLLDGYDKTLAIILIATSITFGFIGFISILAYSELIKVFLDIEKNTRK